MTISFNSLPNNFAEFEIYVNKQGALAKPERTCALFICAINLLAKNFEEGIAAINLLKGPQPLTAMEKSWFKDRIGDKLYLSMAYFVGSTPENNYVPTTPYTLEFLADPRPQDCEAGYIRLQIKTPAFDSPRYMKLRQKADNWYIWDVNSIMLGVKTPAKLDPWA